MTHRGKGKMVGFRAKTDPVLAAVLAEIHKTAVKPPKGFLMMKEWGKRWNLVGGQSHKYMAIALEKGLLVMREYRVVTEGRLRLMKHYGPPSALPKVKGS